MINYSIVVRSSKPGTKKDEITETKAYGVAQITETVTLTQFAKHIADHGSVYHRSDVQAVLVQTVDCLREMLLEGKKVELGDLGSFSVGIKTTGAKTANAFTVDNITDVHVKWAVGQLFENMIEDATFQLVGSRQAQADTVIDSKSQTTITPAGGGME